MAFSTSGRGPFSDDIGQGTGGPRFAVLAQVRAYWQGLRHGMALPQRDMIDPRGIAEALESTFLLERVAPGIARFRIAGMHLHDLIGLDVRGMPLSTLFDPDARTRLAEGLEAVFTTPAILEMWLEAERGLGRPRLEGRMLVLPLSDAQGHSTLALGCLALAGALGRAPRRFAMMGLMREALSVEQGADAALKPSAGQDMFTPLPALRKVTGISADGPQAPPPKPKLRLVHSRD
jgi:hypothetical protein